MEAIFGEQTDKFESTLFCELYCDDLLDASADQLQAFQLQCMQLVYDHVQHYIWQRDRFQLCCSSERQPPWTQSSNAHGVSYLWSLCNVGDNVEDEWFIVWLLKIITQQFPGCSARVWDTDGDFLLIEAAYALPKWLNPDTSTNRVWIREGVVHIIPLPSAVKPTLPPLPSITQALAMLAAPDVRTQAANKINGAVIRRLAGYPQTAYDQLHIAHAVVPARIAYILSQDPQIVSGAVEAFHYRDVDDMKAAVRMRHFPPEDMTSAAVQFSRCLYAQLVLQRFEPPKGYPMPPVSSPLHKSASLGLKLTAGFEMMYSNRTRYGAAVQEGTADTSQPLDVRHVDSHPGWQLFLKGLSERGYFGDVLEGSQQYTAILHKAMASFVDTETYRRATEALSAPAVRIDELLQAYPGGMPQASEKLPPESDEGWLNEGSQQLDEELLVRQQEMSSHGPHGAGHMADGLGEADELNAEDAARRMKNFMNKLSSFEGAEVPGENNKPPSLKPGLFCRELAAALGLDVDKLGIPRGSDDEEDDDDDGDESWEGSWEEDSDDSSEETCQDEFRHMPAHCSATDDVIGCVAGVPMAPSSPVPQLPRNSRSVTEDDIGNPEVVVPQRTTSGAGASGSREGLGVQVASGGLKGFGSGSGLRSGFLKPRDSAVQGTLASGSGREARSAFTSTSESAGPSGSLRSGSAAASGWGSAGPAGPSGSEMAGPSGSGSAGPSGSGFAGPRGSEMAGPSGSGSGSAGPSRSAVSGPSSEPAGPSESELSGLSRSAGASERDMSGCVRPPNTVTVSARASRSGHEAPAASASAGMPQFMGGSGRGGTEHSCGGSSSGLEASPGSVSAPVSSWGKAVSGLARGFLDAPRRSATPICTAPTTSIKPQHALHPINKATAAPLTSAVLPGPSSPHEGVSSAHPANGTMDDTSAGAAARVDERWETMTATDSDDEQEFMDQYDAALTAELSGSSMAHSFAPRGAYGKAAAATVLHTGAPSGTADNAEIPPSSSKETTSSTAAESSGKVETSSPGRGGTSGKMGGSGRKKPEGVGKVEKSGGSSGAATGGESQVPKDLVVEERGEGLMEVMNLDMNLVQNLVDSFVSQQGLPGPAGNLAGMLGLKLPTTRGKK